MKVVSPRLKCLELRGAFGFDKAFFASQRRLFESVVGKPAEAHYSLQVRSGAKYEVDTLDGLDSLPFNDVKGRSSFTAEYTAGDQSVKIEIRYWTPAWISISGWSKDAAERIAGEASAAVEASRLWYSWMFGTWTGGLVAIPAGLFLGTLLLLSEMAAPEMRLALLAYATYFVLVGIAFTARRHLFDAVVMKLGPEESRQVSLAKSRGYLFGTVLGGIAIAVIGAGLSALF